MEHQQQWQHQWQKERQRLQLVAAQCAQTSSAMSPEECKGGVEGKARALITPSSIKRLSSCAQSPYATSPLSLPLFASGTTDVRNAAQLPIKLTHKINTHIYIYTYIVYMFIFHVHYSAAMKLLLKASNWQKKCGQREKNVQLIEENLAYPCRRY